MTMKVIVTYSCLPKWIVGVVDYDGLRLGVEFTRELIRVKFPVSTCDELFFGLQYKV